MIDITKFKAIFSGLDIAYGTYIIKAERGDGKQAGQATVVRKPPTDDLWERHLAGIDPSLGIIPIRADNTGRIDLSKKSSATLPAFTSHTKKIRNSNKIEIFDILPLV